MSTAAAGQRPETPRPRDVHTLLHKAGLRSTRQRIALASLLLATAKRRVTAESLYDEVHEALYPVSRATVCNTLRQFERAGLLRRITVHRSNKAWFSLPMRMPGDKVKGVSPCEALAKRS
jgi:Fur family iron response transcriptional regulator